MRNEGRSLRSYHLQSTCLNMAASLVFLYPWCSFGGFSLKLSHQRIQIHVRHSQRFPRLFWGHPLFYQRQECHQGQLGLFGNDSTKGGLFVACPCQGDPVRLDFPEIGELVHWKKMKRQCLSFFWPRFLLKLHTFLKTFKWSLGSHHVT